VLPLTQDEYVAALRGLFSGDPQRIRDANRRLFKACVTGEDSQQNPDLALAEASATGR
jgi:hypothetical protein